MAENERADSGESGDESDSDEQGVDAHRYVEAGGEPFADEGERNDGQRALTEARGEGDGNGKGGEAGGEAHGRDDRSERDQDGGDDGARPVAVGQLPAGKTEGCADEGRPEIDSGVGDAIEVEVAEQRFGDEAETLRAAGQC